MYCMDGLKTVIFKPAICSEAVKSSQSKLQGQVVNNNGHSYISVRTDDNIEFSGPVETGSLQHDKYFLCAINAETGEVEIAPTDLYVVHPFNDSVKPEEQSNNAALSKKDENWRDSLVDEFGNEAAKKKALESRRTSLGVSYREFTMIARKTENAAKTPIASSGTASSLVASLLPVRNENAKKPEEIFNVDDICPPDLSDALGKDSELLSGATEEDWKTWRESKTFPDFVLDRLSYLPPQGLKRNRCCTLLAYFCHLLKLNAMNFKQVNRKVPLPDTPEPVARHLLRNYTLFVDNELSKRRSVPLELKDKQLMHMIIILLTLDGYQIEVPLLTKSFTLSAPRVKRLLKMIGCSLINKVAADGSKIEVAALQIQSAKPKAAPSTPVPVKSPVKANSLSPSPAKRPRQEEHEEVGDDDDDEEEAIAIDD